MKPRLSKITVLCGALLAGTNAVAAMQETLGICTARTADKRLWFVSDLFEVRPAAQYPQGEGNDVFIDTWGFERYFERFIHEKHGPVPLVELYCTRGQGDRAKTLEVRSNILSSNGLPARLPEDFSSQSPRWSAGGAEVVGVPFGIDKIRNDVVLCFNHLWLGNGRRMHYYSAAFPTRQFLGYTDRLKLAESFDQHTEVAKTTKDRATCWSFVDEAKAAQRVQELMVNYKTDPWQLATDWKPPLPAPPVPPAPAPAVAAAPAAAPTAPPASPSPSAAGKPAAKLAPAPWTPLSAQQIKEAEQQMSSALAAALASAKRAGNGSGGSSLPALTIDDSYAKEAAKFRAEHEARMRLAAQQESDMKARSEAATAANAAEAAREAAARKAKAKPCEVKGCASKQ